MQISYTPEILLSELQTQGVIVQSLTDGNLYINGKLSDTQFEAIRTLKPQIINLINENQIYRCGSNEYLLFDLDAAFRVFDISNDSANKFFLELIKHGKRCEARGVEMICFCQPSKDAYRSELNLCRALESANGESLQTAFAEFIETHTLGNPLGVWMQQKDAPLWQVNIYRNGKITDAAVCNAIQSAIFAVIIWREIPRRQAR